MSRRPVLRRACRLSLAGLLAGLLAPFAALAQTPRPAAPVDHWVGVGPDVAVHVLSPAARRAAEVLFGGNELVGQQPTSQQEGSQNPTADQPDGPETAA